MLPRSGDDRNDYPSHWFEEQFFFLIYGFDVIFELVMKDCSGHECIPDMLPLVIPFFLHTPLPQRLNEEVKFPRLILQNHPWLALSILNV